VFAGIGEGDVASQNLARTGRSGDPRTDVHGK
jgi:hypothetical protein